MSIHIRRGDYLTFSTIYGGICTIEYYKKAVSYLCSALNNPVFVVFSDDMDWVRNNIYFPEEAKVHFVDFNRGKDSWQDMNLMSKCMHNIIANSTFSWWGAWLNENPEKIVICPDRLTQRGDSPDIFPEEWIKMSGS